MIAPILAPLGFGTIEASVSLLSAILAKELAVSALVVSYGAGDISALSSLIAVNFTTASALSYMVFTLLYIPCLANIGVIYSETKSKKYAPPVRVGRGKDIFSKLNIFIIL